MRPPCPASRREAKRLIPRAAGEATPGRAGRSPCRSFLAVRCISRYRRAQVRPRQNQSTSRTPCASSTTAGSEYLAHSVREFSYGTIILRCLSECGDEAPGTVGGSPVCSGRRITALRCAAEGRVRRTRSATESHRASGVVV